MTLGDLVPFDHADYGSVVDRRSDVLVTTRQIAGCAKACAPSRHTTRLQVCTTTPKPPAARGSTPRQDDTLLDAGVKEENNRRRAPSHVRKYCMR
jgi:hypothetical protein